MPETHEIIDLFIEFNKSENTIVCTSASHLYHRICSMFARSGIPFVTVPQDDSRIIVVLADQKTWKPVFDLASSMDDSAMVRDILESVRTKVDECEEFCAGLKDPRPSPPCPEPPASPFHPTNPTKVYLTGVPDFTMKIRVIKAVHEITSLGLKEAKELVDRSMGTYPIGTYLPASCRGQELVITCRDGTSARKMASKIEEAGGIVKLDPPDEYVPF